MRKTTVRPFLVASLVCYSALLAVASLMPVRSGSALGATPARRAVNNLLHIPAYGALAGLWYVVLSSGGRRRRGRASVAFAALAAAAFGGLMEVGQAFSPGRHPGWDDVAVNTLGVGVCVAALWVWRRLRRGGAKRPAPGHPRAEANHRPRNAACNLPGRAEEEPAQPPRL